MADIVTGTVTGIVDNTKDLTLQGVSDIRREGEVQAAQVNLENMKGFDRVNTDVLKSAWQNTDATKDAMSSVLARTHDQADNLANQISASATAATAQSREIALDGRDNRTQLQGLGYQIRDGFFAAGKDSEINALKTQVDAAKNTSYLGDKIGVDGDKTRAMIMAMNNEALNRALIERNAELTEIRGDARHLRHAVDQGQWQNLNSQLQAFQSQLTETRQMATQGTVNFGSMSGNAGRNTSTNNVV